MVGFGETDKYNKVAAVLA